MSNVLRILVRFLDPEPAFHGKRDGGEPEWPPSPLRLFQALVDAAASRWRESQFGGYAKRHDTNCQPRVLHGFDGLVQLHLHRNGRQRLRIAIINYMRKV